MWWPMAASSPGKTRVRPKRLQSRWCRLWQGARAAFQTGAGLCHACPLLVSCAHELAHFFFGRCFRGQGFGLLGQYMGEHAACVVVAIRSEEHTSELQSQSNLVCRLLLEKKKKK